MYYSNDAPAEFPLGDTVVTWTATDANGNSVTATQIITVYKFSGALSPVNAITTYQDIKTAKISQYNLGSTIPVKFCITDKNNYRIDTFTATLSHFKYTNALPANADFEDAVATNASTTENLFRYDLKDNNQYIYNFNTKAIQTKATGTYVIRISLNNGQNFD